MKRSRTSALIAALLVVLVAAFAIVSAVRGRRDADLWGDVVSAASRVPLPAPQAVADSGAVRATDFVGAESCASCHATQFAAWQRSTHGNAGGPPNAARVIAPFDGRVIRFRDATVIPRANGSDYTFTVRRAGEPDITLRVDGVVGGGHMRGGGTQGFATRWVDGTYRFLPFDYSRQSATWFCNTDSRTGHAWVPITAELPLAACGDWPPARVLGDEPRFSNCQGCHASQLEVRLDTTARAYRTSFTSLAINCESCHGPARAHVEAARRGLTPVALRPLATLDKDASTEVCAACHAVKARVAGGYLPGRTLADHYSTRLALFGDSLLKPDGRTHTFAYQEGQAWSDCYVNGGMSCTSCHDPHTQGYRDVTGASLPRVDADEQCTSCHASKGVAPEAHTKHAATSAGSRCVACHMPYLQQPAVGTRVRYGRSDHTIAIPRPAFDESLGVPNACATCHATRSTAQLDGDVRRLWGEIKPHAAPVAALVRAATTTDPAEAARLLLDTTTHHVAAQYAGLARYVDRFIAPDMPSLPRDALVRLRALARARDVDVRALALAALHYAGGERTGVRALLGEQLRGARDDAQLRARWATALGTLADDRLRRGDASAAARGYERATEVRPSDARLFVNLGLARAAAGDPAQAATAYARALTLDPAQPLALVNLGIAREALGDQQAAVAAYQRALSLNAFEPLALANLGTASLRAGDASTAIAFYERALAVDPSLASVHFALAQALGQRGELVRALTELRRGLVFDSSDVKVRELERALTGQLQGAGRR